MSQTLRASSLSKGLNDSADAVGSSRSSARNFMALSQLAQVTRHITQTLRTILGNHHVILNPHAIAAWQVDAWLDGEGHAWLQQLHITAAYIRILVRLHPYAVTGTVGEVLSIAGLFDHGAGGAINLAARDAW